MTLGRQLMIGGVILTQSPYSQEEAAVALLVLRGFVLLHLYLDMSESTVNKIFRKYY